MKPFVPRWLKSVFTKYFFSYLVLLGFAVLVYGFFIYNNSVRSLQYEVETAYAGKISRIAEDLDEQLGVMTNIAFEISGNRSLKPAVVQGHPFNEITALEEIREYSSRNILIDDLIYFIKDNNYFYTAQAKYTPYDLFTIRWSIKNSEALLKEINEAAQPKFIQLKREDAVEDKYGGLMACIYPISTYNSFIKDAVVIYIIGENTLVQRLNDLVGELPGYLMLHSSGAVLLDINSSRFSNAEMEELLFKQSFGDLPVKINYMKQHITLFKAFTARMGITLYYAMPAHKYVENVSRLWFEIRLGTIIILFLGIIISILLSYLNYKPIKNLLKSVYDILPSAGSRDRGANELDRIGDSLRETISRNINLTALIGEKTKAMRQQTLMYILKNEIDLDILESTRKEGICLNGPFYAVAVIDWKLDGTKWNMAVLEAWVERMNGYSSANGTVYGLISAYEQAVFILNLPDDEKQTRRTMIKELCSPICRPGMEYQAYVGAAYKDGNRINTSYIEALSVREAKNNNDDKREVVLFEEIVGNYSHFSWYPSEIVLHFLQSLKQGDEKIALQHLLEIHEAIKTRDLSRTIRQYICFDIINSLLKTMTQIHISIDPIEINNLAAFRSMEELFEKLAELTGRICRQVYKHSETKDKDIAAHMLKYMQTCYADYNISLNAIAEDMKLPVYYLSKVFKEQTGIGFKEYIVNLRIENSKRLLSDSSMSVKEISEKVGYTNPSHFIKSFKANEGITPVQYKKLVENGGGAV